MSAPATTITDATHLGKNRAGLLLKLGGAILLLGLLLSGAALASDKHRFASSYLVGFMWTATIGLGGLFFVLIQHLTRAGWSVAPRRQAEWIAGVLLPLAILFIPVAIFSHDLFHHWMDHEALKDPLIAKKHAYLNPTFFYIRAAVFLAAWAGLAYYFTKTSRKQDESGDPELTNRMQAWSAPSILIFALTLTFAGFDWVMSLNPHWYSTIFGVYIFSGAVTSSLALLALLTIGLQKSGLLGHASTVEHRHDIGKLLFGFTVFWAYIAFSQFFLIWYANIPEETIFYVVRWEAGWKGVSLSLIFGHFWIPFFLLLSRHVKRSYLGLGIGAVLHLCMHYVDIYWLIKPNFDATPVFSWIDVAGLLLPAGVLLVWLALRAGRDPLYPLKDPRLPEAAQLVNL
jgi:hypothetical protein